MAGAANYKLIGLNPWTFAYLLFVPLVQASPKVERGDARKGERTPGPNACELQCGAQVVSYILGHVFLETIITP